MTTIYTNDVMGKGIKAYVLDEASSCLLNVLQMMHRGFTDSAIKEDQEEITLKHLLDMVPPEVINALSHDYIEMAGYKEENTRKCVEVWYADGAL